MSSIDSRVKYTTHLTGTIGNRGIYYHKYQHHMEICRRSSCVLVAISNFPHIHRYKIRPLAALAVYAHTPLSIILRTCIYPQCYNWCNIVRPRPRSRCTLAVSMLRWDLFGPCVVGVLCGGSFTPLSLSVPCVVSEARSTRIHRRAGEQATVITASRALSGGTQRMIDIT